MEYLAIIHSNSLSQATDDEWNEFFSSASAAGIFPGGSAIGNVRIIMGRETQGVIGNQVGGYMKFECADMDTLKKLIAKHPVIMHGGSIELVDLPKS